LFLGRLSSANHLFMGFLVSLRHLLTFGEVARCRWRGKEERATVNYWILEHLNCCAVSSRRNKQSCPQNPGGTLGGTSTRQLALGLETCSFPAASAPLIPSWQYIPSHSLKANLSTLRSAALCLLTRRGGDSRLVSVGLSPILAAKIQHKNPCTRRLSLQAVQRPE
jgi:hypothetical protein